jgi:hypothetical protein
MEVIVAWSFPGSGAFGERAESAVLERSAVADLEVRAQDRTLHHETRGMMGGWR